MNEVDGGNGELSFQTQHFEISKDEVNTEMPSDLVQDSAQDPESRVLTCSQADIPPSKAQVNNKCLEAPCVLEETAYLSKSLLDTSGGAINCEQNASVGEPHANNALRDLELAIHDHEIVPLPTGDRDTDEQPDETSYGRENSRSIGEEISQEAPPLPATNDDVGMGIRGNRNGSFGKGVRADNSAADNDRPISREPPPKSRIRRYWDRLMEECRSCSCFTHVGEARP